MHQDGSRATPAHAAESDPYDEVAREIPVNLARYRELKRVLAPWKHLYAGKEVLDFGAGWGLSVAALLHHGASSVIGVEPDRIRVDEGNAQLERAGFSARGRLHQFVDTRRLPFESDRFDFVLANAVLEHIPQPRDEYVGELWRMVRPGGVLFINETPNKYFPSESHTTGLWFNHWLPSNMAYRRSIRRGRFEPDRTDWDSSGWRGAGYFELVRALSGYKLLPESSRLRHRLFTAVGIPASILDPYPVWIFQKRSLVETG